MADMLTQVTIPASGKIQISANLPPSTPPNTYVQQLQIQNNSGGVIRIGDNTVSTTRGILIASGTPGGSDNLGAFINYGSYLSDWWVAGQAGLVVDILFVK